MTTAVIVDDEPITRMDLKEILTENGLDVLGDAADGFDAIEMCRAYHPDVVLMDIRMPLFDGLSAAETILEEDLAGCVVLLTSYSDREFIERAKDMGITGYLVKPLEERLLLPTIEIAMAQRQRIRQMQQEVGEISRKLDEQKLIDRARAIVARQTGLSESEAYGKIQKLSMDKRRSMVDIARTIVRGDADRTAVDKAKARLMEREGLSEAAAYKRIRDLSARENCDLGSAARRILKET